MKDLAERISNEIRSTKIEKYDNIVYHVLHNDENIKREIKQLFKQGDCSKYHTVVEIDFVKKPVKMSRKARRELKNQIQLVNDELEDKLNDRLDDNINGPAIRIYNSPIYIYGEYIKMSRNMTQTPLMICRSLKTERSVSDFTGEFQKFYSSGPVKFMSCGREDIDVRCLEGRPFIIEVQSPKKNIFNDQIPIDFYKEIDIKNCALAKKDCKDMINSDESNKYYNLDIYSLDQISFDSKYYLEQKTPLRVLHRRANMVRNKTIEVLKVTELVKEDGHYYEVSIKASSGTYIKEWVNGDFGRTSPNLNADLLNLDVLRVEKQIGDSAIIRKLHLIKTFTRP